jgi:hypothetical protein
MFELLEKAKPFIGPLLFFTCKAFSPILPVPLWGTGGKSKGGGKGVAFFPLKGVLRKGNSVSLFCYNYYSNYKARSWKCDVSKKVKKFLFLL